MVKRVVSFEGRPRAYRVEVARCGDPECGCPHLLLFDEDDEPIAQAVLSDEIVAVIGKFAITRRADGMAREGGGDGEAYGGWIYFGERTGGLCEPRDCWDCSRW